jgi:hypothetical protein
LRRCQPARAAPSSGTLRTCNAISSTSSAVLACSSSSASPAPIRSRSSASASPIPGWVTRATTAQVRAMPVLHDDGPRSARSVSGAVVGTDPGQHARQIRLFRVLDLAGCLPWPATVSTP